MTLQEIETAIANLPGEKLVEFRNWFLEFDADLWDHQIEEDATSGRLRPLAQKAIEDFEEGRCREL